MVGGYDMRLTIMLLAITSIMMGCVTRQEITVETDAEPSDSTLQWPQRWLDLGMHGELIASRRYPTVVNRLKIMPKDGGFALVHTGPKWSGTYAVVRPDCKIKIIPPVPEEIDLHSAAKYWPYRDDKGFPTMPPYGTVIATKHSVNPPDITPPENMIGWLFLCADGEFYTPKKDVPVHANTLWVVRQDDGLQIIRTGPEKKVRFMQPLRSTVK